MNKQVEQLNNEGVQFFLNGNLKDAKTKYQEALEISPGHPTTLNNLGMLYLQEKDFEKAELYFREANKEKDNPTYLLNLGHVFANQNLLQKAEEFYLKSIELNPDSLMAWKSLASLCQFMKNYSRSVKIWENIIQNYSRDPYYKIQLAKDLIELKEYQYALNVLSQASQFEKFQEIAWYYTAIIHVNSKNFGLAETAINKSLAIKPDNESFRILAATIYLSLSQLNQALFHWNYLLRLNENNHKIRTDKGVALLAHGFKNEALTEFNLVISRDQNNAKALYYKALALHESDAGSQEALQILRALGAGEHVYAKKAAQLLAKYES